MKKYICSICGYVYDEAVGDPNNGIAPGSKWEDVPDDIKKTFERLGVICVKLRNFALILCQKIVRHFPFPFERRRPPALVGVAPVRVGEIGLRRLIAESPLGHGQATVSNHRH